MQVCTLKHTTHTLTIAGVYTQMTTKTKIYTHTDRNRNTYKCINTDMHTNTQNIQSQ